MELYIISNFDINTPSFKLNTENDVVRQVIIDEIEVIWSYIEIKNGLYIDNIRYPSAMHNKTFLKFYVKQSTEGL